MRPDVTLISLYPRAGRRHDGDSGVSSYTGNLAHALADAGAEVCVIAPELEGEPSISTDGPITVRRAFRAGVPGAVPAALRAADRTGAPVVHLQHELFLYSGAAGLPSTLAAIGARGRRRERTLVITMHQVVRPEAIDRSYTRMHRIKVPAVAARAAIGAVQAMLPRIADAVIVHEPAFTEIVQGSVHIPHGIEIPSVPTESRDALRARLGVDDGRTIALCFGFLAPYKGIETALQAVRPIAGDVHLVVAGGEHPRLVAQGDRYAESLAAEFGDVATFTGFVPDGGVADWFRAADVALQCYPEPHASSGPLALALAHDTPVLLSARLADVVGAPSVLRVEGGAAAWTRRLSAVAADPDHLARLAAASAVFAGDRSWPAVARRHLELYREVSADVPSDPAADVTVA